MTGRDMNALDAKPDSTASGHMITIVTDARPVASLHGSKIIHPAPVVTEQNMKSVRLSGAPIVAAIFSWRNGTSIGTTITPTIMAHASHEGYGST